MKKFFLFFAAITMAVTALAQPTNKPITQLTTATSKGANSWLPIVQDGVTKKIKTDSIAALIFGMPYYLSTDSTGTYGSESKLITERAAKAYARLVGGGGGGITDGPKGDITVSGTGTLWNINNGVVAQAKIDPVYEATLVKGADSGLVKTVATITPDDRMAEISQIGNYSGKSRVLTVEDTLRGGQFVRYTGTDPVDNGMIFIDALGRKWLRRTEGDKINVAWYGAKADVTVDCAPLFEAARDYVYKHPRYILFVPYSKNATAQDRYFFTRELKFTKEIHFEGQESPRPKLHFPANMKGIYFQQYLLDYQASMKNFSLEHGGVAYPDRDSSVALITVRCRIFMEKVNVVQSSGICMAIVANSGGDSTTNPTLGNASTSSLKDCDFRGGYIGLYIQGDEASAMQIESCNFQANVRWGVLDDGFLGNKYVTCSFHGDGYAGLAGARSVVLYAGNYYQATPLHDDGSGVGKRPDLWPTYWKKRNLVYALAWDTTLQYISGGSIYIKNPNATAAIFEPYIEGDDGPIEMNARSIRQGGTDGTGADSYQGASVGQTLFGYKINSSVWIPPTVLPNTANFLRLNMPDDSDGGAIFQVRNQADVGIPASFNSVNSVSLTRFKSTAGDVFLGNFVGDILFRRGSDHLALMGATDFKPALTNTLDLGTSAERWKNVYAASYTGSGAGLTSIPQSAVTGLPADLLSLFKKSAYYNIVATDANITAAAGTVYHLPAATLSANRTINVSALTTENDYIELLNNEAGFTWSFTGATVYLVDGTTTVANLTANAHYKIRLINGKLIIL